MTSSKNYIAGGTRLTLHDHEAALLYRHASSSSSVILPRQERGDLVAENEERIGFSFAKLDVAVILFPNSALGNHFAHLSASLSPPDLQNLR